MKMIHCADLHLDSKLNANLDRDKATLRRQELLDTFSNMVDYAADNGVDVILIAGDMFDKTHIRKQARSRVIDEISTHPDIDFLYLQGNHDRTDFLQDVDLTDLPNLKLFSDAEWRGYRYDDVVVTGREITADNAKTFTMNLVLDQADVNIVMLHGQESDYMGNDKTQIVPLYELRGKYIDYLALGHIHSYKRAKLDDRGEYCYCGCLEGRGFDECGEKGFVLLTVEDKKVESEFIPFAKRSLHEAVIEITPEETMPQILDALEEAVSHIPGDDMVKAVLTGVVNMDGEPDRDRIRSRFAERFFFFKVYDQTRINIDYDSFVGDRSLKGEFARIMRDVDLPEDKKARIVEIGMKALMEEEIEG
ncbi:MAG: metallophosphoesterase family protein [Lachnospiraceae bacterium]|nr:metallophosphoesterase family protein [Lachnospiraceae bacterium]